MIEEIFDLFECEYNNYLILLFELSVFCLTFLMIEL